jgi:hypothetical protein
VAREERARAPGEGAGRRGKKFTKVFFLDALSKIRQGFSSFFSGK